MELIDVNVKWSQEEWMLNCHCVKKELFLDKIGSNGDVESWIWSLTQWQMIDGLLKKMSKDKLQSEKIDELPWTAL